MESVNIGAEYVLNQMIFLRGGYNTLFAKDSETGLSFGGGLKYTIGGPTLVLDYAYRDFGILNQVQMFTLEMRFNPQD